MNKNSIRLGVNIDHVATLRNARGQNDPSVLRALFEAADGGAQIITIHLREDRRHIRDEDVHEILRHSLVPVNLEMALNDSILDFALKSRPYSVCIVPERREEVTTEGGLDVIKYKDKINQYAKALKDAGISVYLFIDPEKEMLPHISPDFVDGIEVHTGSYANHFHILRERERELEKIRMVHDLSLDLGLEFHAGHGLNYHNIRDFLIFPQLKEVNIGHAILSRALSIGLKNAVREMKELIL